MSARVSDKSVRAHQWLADCIRVSDAECDVVLGTLLSDPARLCVSSATARTARIRAHSDRVGVHGRFADTRIVGGVCTTGTVAVIETVISFVLQVMNGSVKSPSLDTRRELHRLRILLSRMQGVYFEVEGWGSHLLTGRGVGFEEIRMSQ
jgi:hypothetical protein